MIPETMRAARLHGIEDVRVEELPVPEPEAGELLVRIEACGICPTDARKFSIGVNDGDYPFNPGHEWVGRVVAAGGGSASAGLGERVYGDTYAGYAEFATIAAEPSGLSAGALPLGDLALERAVFVEPLADCLHAVHDQGRVEPGDRVAVIGAGSMGLQMIAAARRAGADVLAVEPRAERRALAERFGAGAAIAAEGWGPAVREWSGGPGAAVVLLTVGHPEPAAVAVTACAPGGRVVLFAGFGDQGVGPVDLNRLHYEEITLVGSEWVGLPPNEHLERYAEARDLLADPGLPIEELVSDAVGLDGVAGALRAVREQRSLKTILYPGGAP